MSDTATAPTAAVTLGGLFRRFRGRILITFALVLLEAAALLLFPLFIGNAINGLLRDDLSGVVALGGLGVAALAVGATRRLIDTRTYARVYETTATDHVAREHGRGTEVSTISARTTLLNEFVEFLENSMPEIVNSAIGIVGTLVILASIDGSVALAALGLTLLVAVVYTATGRWNVSLTAGYNDELEQQVNAIQTRQIGEARGHFSRLMVWNKKLSDLETLNFSLIYIGVIALLVYSPIALVDAADAEYGSVFAALMYVLQYVEAVLALPLFVQQLIRLKEISRRLSAPAADGVGRAE
ncbi:MAG: ABC transporter six-transmembrane domain-containing protein [Actinomycetota bacterium]